MFSRLATSTSIYRDKKHEVGLVVDEWGTWYNVEPGTNPGFLYQQNTMRDALVACISLNIFNKHCDRVKMANIAQMVNVLQSVILTEGSKMVKTPTYHVFNMFKYHQDGELIDSTVETEEIGISEEGKVPNLSESVSIGKDGLVHITLGNLSADSAYEIRTSLNDSPVRKVTGEILTEKMNAHNTFEEPENVKIVEFNNISVNGNEMRFTIPACSVLHLAVEI